MRGETFKGNCDVFKRLTVSYLRMISVLGISLFCKGRVIDWFELSCMNRFSDSNVVE